MTRTPCECSSHPSGRAIRAVAEALTRSIDADEIALEDVQQVFELIQFVQAGLEQILSAGEGDDAIENHFAGFAYDITALRDGLREHIPALAKDEN